MVRVAFSVLLLVASAQAFAGVPRGEKHRKAAELLASITGDRHVICLYKKPTGTRDRGRTEFFAMRHLNRDLDIALVSEITMGNETETGFVAYVKSGHFLLEVGDDSPH